MRLSPGVFEPQLEHAYQDQTLERGIRLARAAALIATPSIPLFIIWDRRVAPEAADAVLGIRAAIVVAFLVAFALTFTRAVRYFTALEAVAVGAVTIGLPLVYERLEVFDIAAPSLLLPFVWIPVIAVRWRQAIIDVGLASGPPLLIMSRAGVPDSLLENMGWWFAAGTVFALGSWLLVDGIYRRVFLADRALAHERERSERLLRNVLPDEIAERLKANTDPVADRHESVTVLFADIAGFTPFTKSAEPRRVVDLLNELFSEFDELVTTFGAEKIKTIGDGYLAACGVPTPVHDHADRGVELGLALRSATRAFAARHQLPWQIRVGVHSGPVIAGVIGKRKFAYDLWGDTVNVASRIESAGAPDEVFASIETTGLLQRAFDLSAPFALDLRGHGAHDVVAVRGTPT